MNLVHIIILKTIVVVCACALTQLALASSVFVVSYKAPDNRKDTRSSYEAALIRLALQKTEAEYGEFHMKLSLSMSVERELKSLSDNTYTNLVLAFPYSKSYTAEKHLDYVPFPIELGILGVRTCFVSEKSKELFAGITDKKQLKSFVHGQGRSWGDVDILRDNGLEVIEVDSYDNLFRMVSAGRFDVFCRGANEVFAEYETHKDKDGIFYDRSIAIRYNFPRFLYFNKNNQALGERLTKGLLTAYADGSLHKLWRKEHGESIDFVEINKRTVFDLRNPYTASINFDYEQYFVEWARQKN